MKKGMIYRLGAYVLVAQMVFAGSLPCQAAQIGSGAYSAEGGTESKSYVLETDKAQIGFGALEQGSTALGQDIVLTNRGTTDISLQWREADYHDAVFVDAPEKDVLAAGESCTFTIEANTSLAPGIYNAFILFGDEEDAYFEDGVQVTIALEITKPVPATPAITSISISPGTAVASKGGTCTFSASVSGENDYNKEVSWSVSGQTSRNTFIDGNGVLNVGSDETASSLVVKAVSRQDSKYSASALVSLQASSYFIQLKASPENGGAVYGNGAVKEGGYAVISAVPEQGYRFVGWTENGKTISTDQEYTVKDISRDMCLAAAFEKDQAKTYTITAASSANGKITPEGKSTVAEGAWILYTITPGSGYQIKNVYVDGKPIGATASYNFAQVEENHTISADFAPIPGADKNSGGTTPETNKPAEPKTEPTVDADTSDRKSADMDEQMQAVEMNPLTGTLQYLNISVQEAEKRIAESDEVELMKGALETGDLQVTIQNDFADTEQETSYNSFYENSGVPNFEIVLEHLLSTEEKMKMLQGNAPVSINLHIEDANGEETPQVQKAFAEKKLPGMNVGQYFEVFLMASKNNDTQMISELPEALKVVINVPAHLKMENRKFYILRLHTKEDGSQDFAQLADEDDNPDTITFSTDKFSPYAIAYIDWQQESGEPPAVLEKEPEDRRLKNVAGIVVVFLALAVTVTGVLYIAGKKKR